ncbi:MAG TPA: PhzF family phenazine biosynthesis protein [Planctomycetota bacterium]|nr:PhzF family phenazine biosynthesis protein [Planctomycetota bacterium]
MSDDLDFRLVDAFTTRAFAGNRAGVVLDATGLDDAGRLAIAREVNASETAFVEPLGGARFRVRFFTPEVEVPLCGHATLSTFLVLASEGKLPSDGRASMECPAGSIPIETERSASGWRVRQTQKRPTYREVPDDAAAVAAWHGLGADDLLGDIPIQLVSTGGPLLLVPVRDAAGLARAKARPSLAGDQKRLGVSGSLLFTLDAPTGFRAEVRMLADAVGIAEDPATGIGAGALVAWLARQGILIPRDGVVRARFTQGKHVGRPSELDAEATVDGREVGRVTVAGEGVVTLRGTMSRPRR